MDGWVRENIESIMLAIEVLIVGGVLAVWVLYFYIKHQTKKKRQREAEL